ncbi:MAG: hypothetical protein QQN41_05795 [Nitrosopumilus sp.]
MTRKINLPEKISQNIELVSKESNGHLVNIKETIESCTNDLQIISQKMSEIQAQGGWDKFWQKSNNIDSIANHVEMVATIQQKSLDLIILLIGAAGTMKSDYNVIIDSIEDLSKQHSGSVEVLDYLVKIKITVLELRKRDELLNSLFTYTNDLRDFLESVNNQVNELSDSFKTNIELINKNQVRLKTTIADLNKNNISMNEKLKAIDNHIEKVENNYKNWLKTNRKQVILLWLVITILIFISGLGLYLNLPGN